MGPELASLETDSYGKTMTFFFNGINELFERFGLEESKLEEISKQIGDYYITRKYLQLKILNRFMGMRVIKDHSGFTKGQRAGVKTL